MTRDSYEQAAAAGWAGAKPGSTVLILRTAGFEFSRLVVSTMCAQDHETIADRQVGDERRQIAGLSITCGIDRHGREGVIPMLKS